MSTNALHVEKSLRIQDLKTSEEGTTKIEGINVGNKENIMILTMDNPQADRTIVLLNGKPVKSWISAKDGEDGWIEIVDITALAPLDKNPGEPGNAGDHEVDVAVEMPTKKINGHVEFRTLPTTTESQ